MKVPCPQCSGEVQLQETSGFVGCPFCGTSLVLDLTGVRPHLLYQPRHGAADVLPLLRRWCDAEGLPPPSGLSSVQLVYRPFWRHLVQGHARLVPAWPALEARWNDVPAPPAVQVIYNQAAVGAGRVIESSVAEGAARRRAFGEGAGAVAAGDLVHVPFYEGQVMIASHQVRVSLEACAGRVYPDRIPQAALASGARRTFGPTALSLSFLTLFLEAMLIPPLGLAAVVVGLTALVLYWILVGGN